MAWKGYFEFDGTEILNVDRTVTYARNHGLYWLKGTGSDPLRIMLGETYASPVIDDAPWVDPDLPESNDFYGTYPLDITGLEDSTIAATVTESVLDGGVVNRPRRATRPIVYSLALLGANERAVEYGQRWLKTALSGAACKGVVDCTGANLCYLASEPAMADLSSESIAETGPNLLTDAQATMEGSPAWFALGSTQPGLFPSVSIKRSGKQALRIQWAGGGNPSVQSTVDGLIPGRTYTARVWVYIPNNGGADVTIGVVGIGTTAFTTLREVWQELVYRFVATGTSHTLIFNSQPAAGGATYFDDASVRGSDITSCIDPLLRTLHKVTITNGPTVTGKFTLPSGGEAWTVSFTAVAGDPYEFMVERPLVQDFLATEDFYLNPAYPPASSPHPWYEVAGKITDEYNCNPAEYRPLYDPNCPLVIPPPGVPSVAVSCFNFPVQFTRKWFTIPEEEIPLWGSAVPIVTLRTGQYEERNLRLRFYADVMGTGDPEQDPCAYCGDIVFSWIPAGSTMVLDGTKRQVIVQTPGQPLRRADAVVFKTNGTPFEWPELTCGFSYLAVVDRVNPAVPILMATKTFEDGLTTGWSGTATLVTSTTVAHSGTRSMRVTWPNSAGGASAQVDNAFTVTSGQQFNLEGWVYFPVAEPTYRVTIERIGGATVTGATQTYAMSAGWNKVTYSATATSTGSVNFRFTTVGNTNLDIVYVDDVTAYIPDTNLRMNLSLVNKVL